MNTCNKCGELPKTGHIYVIDSSLWENKIKGNSSTNLSQENSNKLKKTYYACGKHEEDVKRQMLENLPNLISSTDGLNSENILSFHIVNNIPKPKRRFWK